MAVTEVGDKSYEYDNNGNMTDRDGQTITWNAENKPVSISDGENTSTFVYDADGNQVKKTENGETIIYVNQYYEKNLTIETITTHYFFGGKEIAFRVGTTTQYVHTDHLGSTSVVSNTSGSQVARVLYLPFGEYRDGEGSLLTDKLFTGQRHDETDLYYYGARYYDPTIGRFISPDSIVPNPANPQSLNRYSYCLNNPLRYIDPSGNQGISLTQAELNARVMATWYGAGFLAAAAPKVAAVAGTETMSMGITSTYTAMTAATPQDLFTSLGGKKGGIDSDWGDMLGRANWGDTFTISQGGDTVEVQLVQGQGFVSNGNILGSASTMYLTTAMRDQGNIPKLTLEGHSFKLDDGHKTGDKIKGVAQLAGGIALATAGGVATVAGIFTSPVGVGLAIGAIGGVATTAGWEVSRSAVHNLSNGRYGDPLTLSDLDDIAFGIFPVSYGPWGLTLEGWNGP